MHNLVTTPLHFQCYSLTFRNCGVTNRTVAMRQTCSSSDDCRLRGNDSSSPLQEEVGTASEETFSSNADHHNLRVLSWQNNPYHFYETWSLLQIWHTHIQASPLDPCCLWRDDSKIQYVPHLKKKHFSSHKYTDADKLACFHSSQYTIICLQIYVMKLCRRYTS